VALSNLCHCFAFHFPFSRKFPSVLSTHCTSIQSIMNWWSVPPAAPSTFSAPVRPFTWYVHYSNVMAARAHSHASPAGQFKLAECSPSNRILCFPLSGSSNCLVRLGLDWPSGSINCRPSARSARSGLPRNPSLAAQIAE